MSCFSSRSRIIEGIVLGSAALALACSDAGAGADPALGQSGGAGPGSGGSGGTTSTAGAGGGTQAPSCEDLSACDSPNSGAEGTPMCVESVVADVRDLNGAPVTDFMVQVCGKDQCHRAKSDGAGLVEFMLCRSIVEPALEVVGRSKFVTFAAPLHGAKTSFGTLTLIPLPSQGELIPDAASAPASISSGPVRLDLAAGTSLIVDALECATPDDELLRAIEVPLDKAPPSVEPTLDIEMLIGLAPTCANLSVPAMLTVANGPGWTAGAAVDVLMHGIDPLGESPAPFGGWTMVATAKVTADGQQIQTDDNPGNGIDRFALLGFRLAGN